MNVYMWLHAWRWWVSGCVDQLWTDDWTTWTSSTWLGPRRNMTRPKAYMSTISRATLGWPDSSTFPNGQWSKGHVTTSLTAFFLDWATQQDFSDAPFWIGQGRRRFAFPLVLKASTWGTCGCRRMKQRRLLATACGSFPSTENSILEILSPREVALQSHAHRACYVPHFPGIEVVIFAAWIFIVTASDSSRNRWGLHWQSVKAQSENKPWAIPSGYLT